jgi:hypothetical protein
MYAIEFQTKIEDGIIEIPQQYRQKLRHQANQQQVRVIVLAGEYNAIESETNEADLISQWLAAPLDIPGFAPLTREEAHERR